MNESKTQRNEMADKVIYLSVCLSICIKIYLYFQSAELELEVSNYEHNIIALQQELESTVNSLDYIRNDMEYQITNLEVLYFNSLVLISSSSSFHLGEYSRTH